MLKSEERLKYAYELRSINLFNLGEREAEAVILRFDDFLNSLVGRVQFRIVDDVKQVTLGAELYGFPYKRFFLLSENSIDESLDVLGVKFVKVPSVPELRIIANPGRFLADSEGKLVKVYNITKLSDSMKIGFLTGLYPFTYEIRIDIWPVQNPLDAARKHYDRVRVRVGILSQEGRKVDPEDIRQVQDAGKTVDSITRGAEKLFLMKALIVIRAETNEDLERKRTALMEQLRGYLDSPYKLQKAMYEDSGPMWARGRRIYAPTFTLRAFFPFSGLDVSDPGGTVIGQNLQTGNAIIYDIFDRENFSMAVLGRTGSGKSMFVKAVTSRMIDENTDIFIFDSIARKEYSVGPDGKEETSYAKLIGADIVHFTQGAGLDPFIVFETKRQAGEFIADLCEIKDPGLRVELLDLAGSSSSVADLLERAKGNLKKTLRVNLEPYLYMFTGKTDITSRMVFVLDEIADPKARDSAAFLSLAAIWKVIKGLPIYEKKIIVIDEGWAFVETNPRTGTPYFTLASTFVPEITRTGRH